MYLSTPADRLSDRVQVKICGITAPEAALACMAHGADAIGLVFYPNSPRYVPHQLAAQITSVLPTTTAAVGVFVNATLEAIMDAVRRCRLTAVQLHGRETPDLVDRLRKEGLTVIKALYVNAEPSLKRAPDYNASAFLVECAGGKLPGGNAMDWDWAGAREFARENPTIIAGGLAPENVPDAIAAARPDGVDVSSGVETLPGRKDPNRIRDFIHAVHKASITNPTRRIF